MSPAFIQLSDVMLRYGAGTVALDHTTLGIDEGDFVALVGPSGCGKSTILKLVAGLLRPSAGAVIAGGREVGAVGTRAQEHDVGRARREGAVDAGMVCSFAPERICSS